VSRRNVTLSVAEEERGFETTLNASSVTTSPVASGASCIYFAFAAAAPITAFVTTYDSFVNLVSNRSAAPQSAVLGIKSRHQTSCSFHSLPHGPWLRAGLSAQPGPTTVATGKLAG